MDKTFSSLLTDFLGKFDSGLLFKIAIELIVFAILLNVVNKLISGVFVKIILNLKDLETKKQYNTLRVVSMSVADTILILFFATNILQDLGIDMKPILATAGVLGVAVGFGAQRFVQDVIAGLNILLTGQIRVGDVVKIQGVAGTVERVTVTMVVLRSFEGHVHYIRNGLIDIVTNQTRDFAYVVLDVTVAYKEDIKRVMEVLKETGDELMVKPDFKDKILDNVEILGLDSFLDSSILVKCRIKTYPQCQWEVKRKFNLMMKERFDKEGIEIPFPQVVVTKAE